MGNAANNLSEVLELVSKDKGIPEAVLKEALEAAMLTAARKVHGIDKDIEAHFNDETGEVDVYEFSTVVEEVTNAAIEISVHEAYEYDSETQVGDSIGRQLETRELGRIAAQTAKQVIIQRVREAERENVYNEYSDRREELVTGIVRRFERGSLVIDLGRAEAILPTREQCPRESYRANDRIQAFVIDVNKQGRGSQIVLSRTSPGLLMKLFEMEVPEIYEGIVKIQAAAREPGARSKIAVSSTDRDVDPVGACVGMKGSRVQAVVQELRGEKVDIVPWDEDPARFVCNALAPAEVSRVLIDETNHAMELIVPDDQLSLAIGRRGQNVRLASQLTGWKLDIVSESKVKEVKDRAFKSLSRLEGVNELHMQTLYNYGIRCAQDILDAERSFLETIPGIGAEKAEAIQTDAARVIELEKEEFAQIKAGEEAVAREQAKRMFDDYAHRQTRLPEEERIIRVKGVGSETVTKLAEAGILFVEDLVDVTNLVAIADKAGVTNERLDELIHAGKVFLEKERSGEELAVSTDDAGPEEGYEPSELLNLENEPAEEVVQEA